MNYESQRLQEMVQDRKDHLDQVKEKVEGVVQKINGAETIQRIGDEIGVCKEVQPVKKREEVRTPFYRYLVEMKPKVEEMAPNMKYLEVVAFVQQQWEKMPAQDKLKYQE